MKIIEKKVNVILFVQRSYRRFPAYFRFARKMLREALAASDFNILRNEKYPIPRRVIGKHSNSGHEATGIMQRLYLHRSHASMASCRVGSHRSTTIEDESISFRAKTSLFKRADSRAKGVAFCRRWYSYFTADTSYLTPRRRSLFQYSREKSIDEVTYNYTTAKID